MTLYTDALNEEIDSVVYPDISDLDCIFPGNILCQLDILHGFISISFHYNSFSSISIH